MYVVSSNSSSFKDIDLFSKEIDRDKKVTFFITNKLYFNFLWYQYQYPNCSRIITMIIKHILNKKKFEIF